jgi:hypothetical protein
MRLSNQIYYCDAVDHGGSQEPCDMPY